MERKEEVFEEELLERVIEGESCRKILWGNEVVGVLEATGKRKCYARNIFEGKC